MEMQAIHGFLQKICIFRRTTYTSRRKIFEKKVAERERGKEETRKREHSEIAVFVIEISFKSLFQHTKYFYIKSSDNVKRLEQKNREGNIENGERIELFLGLIQENQEAKVWQSS